jgi:hypothetical protein
LFDEVAGDRRACHRGIDPNLIFLLCVSVVKKGLTQMVEELEQEYAALKNKVRDLQEYL